MFLRVKYGIKRVLQFFGFCNPALGTKISQEAKARMILEYKTPEVKVFVETGTRDGDMIESVGKSFQKIYSIELDTELYNKARERFAGQHNVVLIEGDSGSKIQEVLAELHEPALFWLDAHGDSVPVSGPHAAPIKRELEAIFAHPIKNHTILIDDVRHFDSEGISLVRRLAEMNHVDFLVRDGLFILTNKTQVIKK